jgi:hypothetical protein
MTTNKRIGAGALLIGLLTFGIVLHASGQRAKDPDREAQWEYLVVAGGNANLSTATAGNESYPGMRKQPDTSFGAKGWELVDVHGTPNEPVYFLKRLKEAK